MKLTLADSRLLTDSIAIISELVNEAVFKVDKEKIELVAIDPANVAMVIFKLLSSAFEEYTVEKECELAVSLESLKQVLKRAKPTDVLTLELDEEKNKLKITLQGEAKRAFSISLIDLRDSNKRVPTLEFPLKIKMASTIFNDAIEDMDVVAESLALIANQNNLTIEAESSLNHAKVEILNEKDTSIENSAKEAIRSKYSIEYMKKIIKGSKLSPNVTLEFSKNYPLKVQYEVKDKLQLGFVLAPRVSNED